VHQIADLGSSLDLSGPQHKKRDQLAADLGQRLADLVRWISTSWRRI
jgi:hypothetical protein|tara:strand:+ start:378 stop:518 length:141 start_codon:yes stop_codon:yes gene_type:complete